MSLAMRTQIANRALMKINEALISSLDEQSPNAAKMRLTYASALSECLRAANWGFAKRRKRLNLVEVGRDEVFKYPFHYLYPADCLFLRWVFPEGIFPDGSIERGFEFEICVDNQRRKLIGSNIERACIEYTALIDDPCLYDVLFEDALVCLIAYKVCYAIAADGALSQLLFQEYQLKVNEAIAASLNESREDNRETSSFISCRG